MTSGLSFRWLLTLLALVAPQGLGPARAPGDVGNAPSQQQASADVVFRHYL